ncbi:MCP four helix bundle domain-containing protein [Acidovorax carolinensis]|nr:MCP four helix bundle domain-containing protein [Acidovorax carolinensis]
MSWVNLKIGTRLGLGFTVVLLFLAVVLGMGLVSLANTQSSLDSW